MSLKQRNLGNPEEWEDYDWIRGVIAKDMSDSDPTRKLECLRMVWYYHCRIELGLEPTDWSMEASKDQTPYFNYIPPPNISICAGPSLIVRQASPLSGPVIETSFKNPIPYTAHLRRTSRGMPNNKISLDSPYLSDRFS